MELNPKTYAYPLFAGRDAQTQAANRQAGFIAARGGTRDASAYYICANVREPDNWYNLPSVIMGAPALFATPARTTSAAHTPENAAQAAWTIMTYHSMDTRGMGYYRDEFMRPRLYQGQRLLERQLCLNYRIHSRAQRTRYTDSALLWQGTAQQV